MFTNNQIQSIFIFKYFYNKLCIQPSVSAFSPRTAALLFLKQNIGECIIIAFNSTVTHYKSEKKKKINNYVIL